MLEHVDSVAKNRIVPGNSGLEDVLNRERETRPTALVPIEMQKAQRNDDPLDKRDRGEVEERIWETRPDAPEPVIHPEHPFQNPELQETGLEDVRSRARETHPDARVDLLPACKRTQR